MSVIPSQEAADIPRRQQSRNSILITGGAGFIGINLADRLLSTGQDVLIYDNISRPGAEQNLRWLLERHGEHKIQVEVADIRDLYQLRKAAALSKLVFHLAAQVAVTTSVTDPVRDFETNLHGTLKLLEILRSLENPPPLIFTSTNKVYGGLEDIGLCRNGTRYEPADKSILAKGIRENRPMKFRSPYGCSKGAADQYVLDYSGIYGLRTVVFRMSCIYGPRQFGTEDQGWVAHFLIRAIHDMPLTVYGDGMQVRDILFIDDLLDAFLLADTHMEKLSGEAYNIGGGPENSISLVELLSLIHELHGKTPPLIAKEWRPGDQKYYVTDFGKFSGITGWRPKTGRREGVAALYRWLSECSPGPFFFKKNRAVQ